MTPVPLFVVVAVSAFAANGHASAAVIADSVADFDAARDDGIGVGGTMVAPGSADDAAQQFHTDGSGAGDWQYGFGNSGDGQSFSGGFPLLSTWNGSAWIGASGGPARVSATTQAPNGSTINSDSLTYRRWTSNGAFAGETLTARLAVTLNNAASDGVTVILNVANSLDITAVLTPETVGQEQVFEMDFTDAAGNWVLAAIDPRGVGPTDATNFFNDSVNIQLTIVPAPTSVGALAFCGLAGTRRGRRS